MIIFSTLFQLINIYDIKFVPTNQYSKYDGQAQNTSFLYGGEHNVTVTANCSYELDGIQV